MPTKPPFHSMYCTYLIYKTILLNKYVSDKANIVRWLLH